MTDFPRLDSNNLSAMQSQNLAANSSRYPAPQLFKNQTIIDHLEEEKNITTTHNHYQN